MKYKLVFTLLFTFTSIIVFTQNAKEAAIRKMEEVERQAILALDSSAINKVWADSLIVNSPGNN